MKYICVNMLVFFLICASWMESTSADDEPRTTTGDCFEVNIGYPKNDMGGRFPRTEDKRATPLECQALCKQTEGCRFFTWTKNGCWLKTKGGLAVTANQNEGNVSGFKTCGDCFEENTAYPHNDMNPSTAETTDVRSSPLECQALCKQTEGCRYFTWKETECRLKTKGGVGVAVHSVGAVSGYRICDPIANAIQSTLANPSSARDTTSERSKIVQNIVCRGWIIKKRPDLYIILKELFQKIVENPELDHLFADFSSRFQSRVLPTAIQDEDLNSPLLKSKLLTNFPQEVEDSAELENKEVTVNGTFIDQCPWGGKCTHKWKGGNWISTHLYAKQGQMVTVTVPEHLIGKFAIRINAHTDDVHKKFMKSWLRGKKFKRPSIIAQRYNITLIKQKTRLVTPYGGLIFIDIGEPPVKLGEFTLKFENVITSPQFKQGETTSEEWSKALASSKSPMVELEVPGLIYIIPRSYVDKNNLDMERVASTATKMMNAIHEMKGYVMPRPNIYVADVAIRWGGAHAGYPIMDRDYIWGALRKLQNNGPKLWAMPHEIGHTLEYHTHTPSGLMDVINNIFSQYVNEKVFKGNPNNYPSLKYADQFRNGDKNFSSVNLSGRLNIFKMIQQECSWQTFISFFKFYNEEIPTELIPKTKDEGYSLITRVLSEKCNKNLIPFFQWWNWPVLNDAVEATKDLPNWKGIIQTMETGTRRDPLPRQWSQIEQTKIWGEDQCPKKGLYKAETVEDCKKICDDKNRGCTAINYNHDHRIQCVLQKCRYPIQAPQKTSSFRGYYILNPKDNYTWLQAKLSVPEWKESNTDTYGVDMESKKVNDENECADWCGATRGCFFWTLRKKDNLCWLKNGDLYKIKREGFTSGDKLCASEDALKAD